MYVCTYVKGVGKRCHFWQNLYFPRYSTGRFYMIVGLFWCRPCIKILFCRCAISFWRSRPSPKAPGNFAEISQKYPRTRLVNSVTTSEYSVNSVILKNSVYSVITDSLDLLNIQWIFTDSYLRVIKSDGGYILVWYHFYAFKYLHTIWTSQYKICIIKISYLNNVE